jgi:hypothetical protein
MPGAGTLPSSLVGPSLPPFLINCSSWASTLTTRSRSWRALSTGADTSSGSSWLTHLVPRRWQPVQMLSVGKPFPKKHFSFRRLHSQQLFVPFRIFLRLASDSDSAFVSRSSAMLNLSRSGSAESNYCSGWKRCHVLPVEVPPLESLSGASTGASIERAVISWKAGARDYLASQ